MLIIVIITVAVLVDKSFKIGMQLIVDGFGQQLKIAFLWFYHSNNEVLPELWVKLEGNCSIKLNCLAMIPLKELLMPPANLSAVFNTNIWVSF